MPCHIYTCRIHTIIVINLEYTNVIIWLLRSLQINTSHYSNMVTVKEKMNQLDENY